VLLVIVSAGAEAVLGAGDSGVVLAKDYDVARDAVDCLKGFVPGYYYTGVLAGGNAVGYSRAEGFDPDRIVRIELHSVLSFGSFQLSGSSIFRSPKKQGPQRPAEVISPESFSSPTIGCAEQRMQSTCQITAYISPPSPPVRT
jgi:hypothetical protein